MKLNDEEKRILDGFGGEIAQRCMKFLVTVIALNILTSTPIASVKANPLMMLVPSI